jgi:CHAT domain-containing protein/tetratricopeptide (TPR) repeat protein
MKHGGFMLLAGAALTLALPSPAHAQSIAKLNSFRIGGGANSVLCLAQSMASDAALTNMFDRGYSVICRDATVPIGLLHVIRNDGKDDPAARLAALRGERAACAPPATEQIADIGAVSILECTLAKNPAVPYRVYQVQRGGHFYSAEGLGGYDSAMRIGLRSLVTDRPVPGEVDVALTGAGDPAAFARVQAGTLDRSRALAEAYRRNNSGAYAESAEFFGAVTRGELGRSAQVEALVNEALQKSNLGQYVEADELLKRASDMLGNDPVVARQLRNYRAMHLLNQGLAELALAELDRPLPDSAELPVPAIRSLEIDGSIAARLNSDSAATEQLGSSGSELQLEEKVQILDAQVDLLRGPAMRLLGDLDGATRNLQSADTKLAAVRGGRIPVLVWMRSQVEGELGAIDEAAGRHAEAAAHYRNSVLALQIDYPGSAVLQSARGRQAGFLIRTGQTAEATAIYREIVASNIGPSNATPGLARLLAPYADMLLRNGNDRAAVAELFGAAQAMVRPGVAQTQAVLARELSGGSDEASRLFRQSVTLTRQVERARSELARIDLAASVDGARPSAGKAQLLAQIAEFERDQVATQSGLAAFPQYRAVASDVLSIEELQKTLKPGEAYYKLTVIDDLVFAILATPDGVRALKLSSTANELDDLVSRIRQTIATESFGQAVTLPFDVGLAHRLYSVVFAPVEAELAPVRHLIFEPDGALLRLPPNLLVRDQASVDTYVRRVTAGGDAFDFTGMRWLGRDLDISTSVSARAFRAVRQSPPAKGARAYLGLGDNARPGSDILPASLPADQRDCSPPIAVWNRPISPSELRIANNSFGGRGTIVTGSEFSDSALKDRSDLRDYRILHFATHGLVTPANPHCATQPALLTSFGSGESDGLLTFREIFDLRLDADLVILSACDTAGTASASATRAAGVSGGGGMSLDGLVRAFVGAGGRLVVASHWAVPDDFNATQRLIAGMFNAAPGNATVDALRLSQRGLMDDPATSHPYYWAAFAVIGDGMAPVKPVPAPKIASR